MFSLKPPRRAINALVEDVLLGHIMLTVANNIPSERIASTEDLAATGLDIPRWKFFGPFPGVHDYSLFAREVSSQGELGPWKRVDQDVKRPWHALIWNPGNRRPKVLFDAAQQIKVLAAESHGSSDIIEGSLPFKLLKIFAQGCGFGKKGNTKFQIMLVESQAGEDEIKSSPYFVSSILESNR